MVRFRLVVHSRFVRAGELRLRFRRFSALGSHRDRRLSVARATPSAASTGSAVPPTAMPFTAIPFTAIPFTAEHAHEFASWPNFLELPDSGGPEVDSGGTEVSY